MAKNKLLIVGIVGAAGVGIYLVMEKQKRARAAALMAASQGVAVKPPGLLDTLLGALPAVIKGFQTQVSALEANIKLRGSKHHSAWKAAVSSGQPFYTFGGKCYQTGSGRSFNLKNCGPVAALEGGYF